MLSDNKDLCHRGAVVVMNLMEAQRSLAESLMESEVLEILSVLAKGGAAEHESISRAAQQCLDKAIEYGIIKSGEGGKGTEP